jgi:hypothetical protein
MGMLRPCEAEDCETWTLGSLCLEHEPPAPGPATRHSLQPAGEDGPTAILAAFAATGDSDACRPGDPRFRSLLGVCAGFRVVTPHGRLGRVERLSRDTGGHSLALLVRTGLFRRRLIEVPAAEIDWIVPTGRRILLTHSPDLAA